MADHLQGPARPGSCICAAGRRTREHQRFRKSLVSKMTWHPSTDARRNGNLRDRLRVRKGSRHHEQACQDRSRTHCDGKGGTQGPRRLFGGIVISVLRDGDSWEFRTSADEATAAKAGYPNVSR